MALPVLGIDIAKQSYIVTLRVGNRLQRHTFANQADQFQELSAWLLQQGVKHRHACLEATNRYWEDLKSLRSEIHTRLSNGSPSTSVHNMLSEHLAFLDQQIAALKKQIESHIDQHPGLKQQRDLLASIPGIGNLTAAKLLSLKKRFNVWRSSWFKSVAFFRKACILPLSVW